MSNNVLHYFLDGFFFTSGLQANPSEKAAKAVLKAQPAEKLRNDVKKVNQTLRHQYSKMKRDFLGV